MTHCHCSICRKHHGAPFATYVASPLDGFQLLAGSDRMGRYDSSPGLVPPLLPDLRLGAANADA